MKLICVQYTEQIAKSLSLPSDIHYLSPSLIRTYCNKSIPRSNEFWYEGDSREVTCWECIAVQADNLRAGLRVQEDLRIEKMLDNNGIYHPWMRAAVHRIHLTNGMRETRALIKAWSIALNAD